MDISTSANAAAIEEQGTAIPIRDQFGKPAFASDKTTPAMMIVVGSYSQRYRDALQQFQAWVAEASSTLKDGEEIDPKIRDAKWTEMVLSRSILSWNGLDNGESEFPFSAENAIALLTPRPWIADDVQKAVHKHERFFGEPSTSSRAA
jgi:hypothetical protein